MALKTTAVFSRMASSFSPKIPFATTCNLTYDKFLCECNLVHFVRQLHRTGDPMSPSSVSSPPSPESRPVSEKEQISLDRMVNSYPTARRFIAIGSGGDDFADAMVLAVESVLQEPIPNISVRKRLSSMGRYMSVNIGPVQVTSRDQVKAVYEAMMKDSRLRYFF